MHGVTYFATVQVRPLVLHKNSCSREDHVIGHTVGENSAFDKVCVTATEGLVPLTQYHSTVRTVEQYHSTAVVMYS